MTSLYDIVSGQQSFETLGDTDTVDVVQLWLRVRPRDIVVPIRIPEAVFNIAATTRVANATAIRCSSVGSMPEVGSAVYTQQVSDTGVLTEWLEVHVIAPNMLISRALRFPLAYFVPPVTMITGDGHVSPLWNPPSLLIQQQIQQAADSLNVISEL